MYITKYKYNVVYYCHVDAKTTRRLAQQTERLTSQLPSGWNGIITADPDQTRYLMLAHFEGDTTEVTITTRGCSLGAPVFENETTIHGGSATASFHAAKETALMQTINCFVQGEGEGITARQVPDDNKAIWLSGDKRQTVTVNIISEGNICGGAVKVSPSHLTKVFLEKGKLKTSKEKNKKKK